MSIQTEANPPFDAPTKTRTARLLGAIVRSPFRLTRWLISAAVRQMQNVATAFVQIWANKARSLLTTLGIIIAVTSTITVVSFVEGFGTYVTDMLRGLGTNLMFVRPYQPGGFRGRMLGRVTMDIEDVRAVSARCDKVRRISPMVFHGVNIEYGREKVENVQLRGATEQWQTIRSFFVDEGRFFGPIDVDAGAHVCVLGREVLRLLEADDDIVDDYVYLDGLRFRVLGLLEAKGAMMGENQDNLIIIPYTAAIRMAPWFTRYMPFLVEAMSEEDAEECRLQMTRVLRARHHLRPGQPNDFRIFSQDEFLRDFERVKIIATSILAGIVGISLIVGGIGIMNIMLVSVTERTREIGLRKSVGGQRRDIMAQFLTEAVVLATLGGAIGVVLGFAICSIASQHPVMVDIAVPYWIVAVALSFSAGVGMFFGLVPAFKAAIIHPIDALRYE